MIFTLLLSEALGRSPERKIVRIIFSRKGFDTGSGGRPSPIKDGCPISLPIPTTRRSITRYEDIGLGELVEEVTGGRIRRNQLCHNDPYHADGNWVFGGIEADAPDGKALQA